MKVKAFISIIERLADLYDAHESLSVSQRLRSFASDIAPFSKEDLTQLFLSQDERISEGVTHSDPQAISMSDLGRILGRSADLLKSAGAGAKAKELLVAATAFSGSPASDAKGHIAGVVAGRERAARQAVEELVRQLNDLENDLPSFDRLLEKIGKQPPDQIGRIAVGYVQGRPKYASKAKAIAAIRDKRYERAQLKLKMQGG